ncbi:MAG: site-specific integrase [Planctomycetota bacterium]
MSRKNEPWYWEARKGWYVTLNGKRIKLGKDKEEAFAEFYRLKAENPALSTDSLVIVMDEMVEWTRKNRSAGTFRFYNEHAQQFLDWLKGEKLVDIGCEELTPDIFESYLEESSPGRRNGAVQMIKRVYNWANKRGRIKVNPIMALEKPSSGRRKNYITAGVFKKMLEHSDQNLSDLMVFMSEVGCRPQEAWKLTSEHIQPKHKRLCIPIEDTKRKKSDRHIYCTERAWEIIESLQEKEEFLFTTTTGTQWNKDNIGKRMDSLSKHIGKRYALYDIRHTWITNRLKAGMDTHMIAKLAGTSVAMIERHYDQSDQDAQFMLEALRSSSKAKAG